MSYIVHTEQDFADLWLHMLEDHGASSHSTHGDPVLMHGALNAFGLCGLRYTYAEDTPDFRAAYGANTLGGQR